MRGGDSKRSLWKKDKLDSGDANIISCAYRHKVPMNLQD